MPSEVTPPAQRLLDRLDVPVCVCDAAWTVLEGNPLWDGLQCGGKVSGKYERNVAWRLFTNAPTAVVRSPEYLAAFKSTVVTGLRAATRRYPGDPRLHELIADLRASASDFPRWWTHAEPGNHPDRLVVHHNGRDRDRTGHQDLLDKDILIIEPGDLRVVVFTLADQAASSGSI